MKTLLASTLLAAAFALGLTAAAPAASTTAATVHIKNFKFVPASLTVPAGTTVTFINDDNEPHTATAVDKSFDSDAIDTNGQWSHTFAKPGTYAYFCEMHPYMKGKLTVTAAASP